MLNERNITLDTGKETIPLTLPDNVTFEILKPRDIKPDAGTRKMLTNALNAPIASPRLKDLAFGKKNISVIICDNTRFLPQDIILPMIMSELEEAGVHQENITIIIATY